MKKLILIFMVLTFIAACNYSDGERTGVITKFSKKGIIIKTWEGTMTLGAEGASGTIDNIWHFSVDDEELISDLVDTARSGKLVTLGYREIKPPLFWKGDTGYFITHIIQK